MAAVLILWETYSPDGSSTNPMGDILTRWQQFTVYNLEFMLRTAERHQLIESEEDGWDDKVVRKVRLLDDPDGAVQQGEYVEGVEQLMADPERIEDVNSCDREGEDVHDADYNHEKNSGETWIRSMSKTWWWNLNRK